MPSGAVGSAWRGCGRKSPWGRRSLRCSARERGARQCEAGCPNVRSVERRAHSAEGGAQQGTNRSPAGGRRGAAARAERKGGERGREWPQRMWSVPRPKSLVREIPMQCLAQGRLPAGYQLRQAPSPSFALITFSVSGFLS